MADKTEWIRISELERRSGVPRRTIHFYMQAGLLHAPRKTGKTMAYYDDLHVKKLEFIKSARRKELPIAAIRKELFRRGGAPETGEASLATDGDVPAPTPQKTRSAKTRERILALGCRLFREKGYHQARVSDITSSLDVGKGTFYFYFSDKKALFLECIPRIFNSLFADGWDRLRKIEDPLDRLEARAQMVLPVLSEFCDILQLSKEAMGERDPKLRALGEKTYRSIRRPIEADIERGIRRGTIAETDPKLAATVFIGIMESLQDVQRFDNGSLTPALWHRVSRLIKAGLAKSASASRIS